jgi:hypothetical protein
MHLWMINSFFFVEYPFVPYIMIRLLDGKTTPLPPPKNKNQCLKTFHISKPIDSYGKLWKLGCQHFVVVVVVATTIDMGKQNPLSKLCFGCPTQNPNNTRTSKNLPTR